MKPGRKFFACFISLWFIGIICSISFFASSYFLGIWDPSNTPRISELALCTGLNANTGKPLVLPEDLSNRSEEIGVCGHLFTSVPVHIGINWYIGAEEKSFYHNPSDEIFEQGYFFSRLRSDLPLLSNNFRVEIWNHRNRVGTIFFSIIDK